MPALHVPRWDGKGRVAVRTGSILRWGYRLKGGPWKYAAVRLIAVHPRHVEVGIRSASAGELVKLVTPGDPSNKLFFDPEWTRKYHSALPVWRASAHVEKNARRSGWPRAKVARRGRSSARRSGNPTPSPKARRAFEEWHSYNRASKREPRVVALKSPGPTPKELVKLGSLVRLWYDSDKYTGEMITHDHKFTRPYPVLATDPGMKRLFIVGGRFKVTNRGLIK